MELLIVIAIIGILSIITIPFTQNYIARTQVTEAFTATASLRSSVALYIAENGSTNDMSNDATIKDQIATTKGKYIKSIDLKDDGGIEVSFNQDASSDIQNKALLLTPESSSATIYWSCTSSSQEKIDEKHLPKACTTK